MHILAFDTSTDALSVAVGTWPSAHPAGGAAQVWQHSGPGGPKASAALIPAILALLREAGLTLAELDAIAFGRGPGAFTGLRTACAVAQGLAFGANRPVLPVDTLHAMAEEARHRHGVRQVVVALDARMNEVYTARYDFDLDTAASDAGFQVLAPEALRAEPPWVLAGNAFAAYGDRLPTGVPRLDVLPTAGAMLRLASALLAAGRAVPADDAVPLYIRDKVAFTTDERQARAALAAADTAPTPPR